MGQIVTVATSKGGGGKTLLAQLLAVTLAPRLALAVVDADRNQSFTAWVGSHYEGAPFAVRSATGQAEVVDAAQALAEAHDLVVIDTAGFENVTAASAIACADLVLVPCMPDVASIAECRRTVALIAALGKAARRAIPSRVVPSGWQVGGLAERATLAELADDALPMLRPIPHRAGFRQLSFDGRLPSRGPVRDAGLALARELAALGVVRRHAAHDMRSTPSPLGDPSPKEPAAERPEARVMRSVLSHDVPEGAPCHDVQATALPGALAPSPGPRS